MDAFKPWQFGKLNKIIYVSRGFYCRIKGARRVAARHGLIRPLDLVFETKQKRRGYIVLSEVVVASRATGCTGEYLIKEREINRFERNDDGFDLNASGRGPMFRALRCSPRYEL